MTFSYENFERENKKRRDTEKKRKRQEIGEDNNRSRANYIFVNLPGKERTDASKCEKRPTATPNEAIMTRSHTASPKPQLRRNKPKLINITLISHYMTTGDESCASNHQAAQKRVTETDREIEIKNRSGEDGEKTMP